MLSNAFLSRSLEGCHEKSKPHPNIYEIINVLKRERASTKMKMQMLETGAQQVLKQRSVKQKERQIQNLFAQFNSGAMSLNDYLEAMKYKTQDFVIC